MATSTPAPARLIVGNWKMNGDQALLFEAGKLAKGVVNRPDVRVGICPPATLVHRLSEYLGGTPVLTGGQDCHWEPAGAFTGDVSAQMLVEAGARLVVLGHSERRIGHGEQDGTVARKVQAAVAAGLEPIVCVGETLMQHERQEAMDVVRLQLRRSLPSLAPTASFAIAYEPVWAIGSGLSASVEHVAAVHQSIRMELIARFPAHRSVPILYGGSVNAVSAERILDTLDVGGLLVGGASLRPDSFLPIVEVAMARRLTSLN